MTGVKQALGEMIIDVLWSSPRKQVSKYHPNLNFKAWIF